MAAHQPQLKFLIEVVDGHRTCPTILEDSDNDQLWEGDSTLDAEELVEEEMDCLRLEVQRVQGSMASPRPRVRLQYNDEGLRDRFCVNAQRLLDSLEHPDINSNSAHFARKALRYRNITGRLDDIDLHDPAFDVSKFFGVEWRHVE